MKNVNFKNCSIIIYDNNNNYITKTIITEHNKRENVIEISENLRNIDKEISRLNVLIIHGEGAVEFSGTLRESRYDTSTVALYNERQREVRASIRHTLNSPAVIKSLISESGQMSFSPPLNMIIENISATGVLMKSHIEHFALGSIFEIHANIHGKNVVLYGSVVRKQMNADNTVRYGCKLIFIKKTATSG